jgi:hypothetical protein
MLSRQALLLAAAVCTLTALPAFAQGRGPGGGGPPGLGGGGPLGLAVEVLLGMGAAVAARSELPARLPGQAYRSSFWRAATPWCDATAAATGRSSFV